MWIPWSGLKWIASGKGAGQISTGNKGEDFMKQVQRYWKQLLGIVVVLVVSIIGMGSIMAASVGITISSADTRRREDFQRPFSVSAVNNIM